ncbi:MAG: hypothetical protein JRN21_03475 [Nitrososphaerota archaeon]|nr:hypothetical protein [Nitrososphaerota archaeon]
MAPPAGAPWSKAYVSRIADRLLDEGYSVQREIAIPSIPFKVDLIATRTRREISKFGWFTRTFVLSCVSDPTPESVQQFSSLATDFGFATANRRQTGARASQRARTTLVVAAVVAEAAGNEVKDWIESDQPEKRWNAIDFRVLISGDDGKLHYYKKTPIWGAAYYSGVRDYVDEMLTI